MWLLVFVTLSQTTLCDAFFWDLFNPCPTVTPPPDFNITEYVRKTWYVQRQQVTSYLPESLFFCVTATYDIGDSKQWFRDAITVKNVASRGEINNPIGNFPICATQDDPVGAPAKLRVAPCFLPAFFGGPYWVAAVAEDYSWAIIVAGQPSVEGSCTGEGLCTTRMPGFLPSFGNDQGLWFFSRVPVASEEVIATMEEKALELGLCTAEMKPVVQEGCNYEGADIK